MFSSYDFVRGNTTFNFNLNDSGFGVYMKKENDPYETNILFEFLSTRMNLDEVKTFHEWLGERIKEYEEKRKPFSEFSKQHEG